MSTLNSKLEQNIGWIILALLLGGCLLKFGLIMGRGLFELTLSILIAFFLFRDGGGVARRFGYAVVRIAGERGRLLLEIADNTVREVFIGPTLLAVGYRLVQEWLSSGSEATNPDIAEHAE